MKSMTRYLFIVGRDQTDLYQSLRQEYSGDRQVEVIVDRRRRERQEGVPAYGPERRGTDRRRRRFNGFTVVRQENEASLV